VTLSFFSAARRDSGGARVRALSLDGEVVWQPRTARAAGHRDPIRRGRERQLARLAAWVERLAGSDAAGRSGPSLTRVA